MSTCYVIPLTATIPDANDPPVTWLTISEVNFILDSWYNIPSADRGKCYTCLLPHYNHVYDGVSNPLQTIRLASGGAFLVSASYNQPPPAT